MALRGTHQQHCDGVIGITWREQSALERVRTVFCICILVFRL